MVSGISSKSWGMCFSVTVPKTIRFLYGCELRLWLKTQLVLIVFQDISHSQMPSLSFSWLKISIRSDCPIYCGKVFPISWEKIPS